MRFRVLGGELHHVAHAVVTACVIQLYECGETLDLNLIQETFSVQTPMLSCHRLAITSFFLNEF